MKKRLIAVLSISMALIIGFTVFFLKKHTNTSEVFKPDETVSQSKPPAVAAPEKYGDVKGFLWEVKKGNSTVYLYGSIHVGNTSIFPLHETVEKAYSSSDVLVGEINLNSLLTIKSTLQKSFYSNNDNVLNHLSPTGKEKLSSVCKELGINENALIKQRVWCVGSALSVLQLSKAGYSADAGIDKYFMDKAKGKKKIMELEGADFQYDLLNSFSDAEQEKYFISGLSSIEETKKALDMMFDIFKSGDENKAKVLIEEESMDPVFYKKFIVDRNLGMANKIEGYLEKEKTYFVVAGLAHFIGDDGIVNLMRKKGYTVNKL